VGSPVDGPNTNGRSELAIEKRLGMTDERSLNAGQKGTPQQERMLFVFGIVMLLVGITALLILHVRTALPATADRASSLQSANIEGTNDALQWLKWKLNLSRTQQEEVKPIVEREILNRSALLEKRAVSDSEQKAQLVELRNRALEEIRPLLTSWQQSLLHSLEQEGQS
jgi:hypothetical protein